MKKDKLLICDLDGTLFDTRKVNYQAYVAALKAAGLPVHTDYRAYLKNCWGPTYRTFLPIMGVPSERLEEVHDLKKEFYGENLRYAVENKRLFDIIEALKPTYHTAVVTSGSRNSKDILRYFNRLDLFEVIFTIDDVKHGKPDPEGFFKAMEYFKIAPENTLIFEDSAVGIKAARLTGAGICIVDDFKVRDEG